jgi:hypothetical protein
VWKIDCPPYGRRVNFFKELLNFPSKRSIQLVSDWLLACSAGLCTSEKWLAARGAVITLTLFPCPFDAALFIALRCYLCSPQWNRSFHHSSPGSETEIFYHAAWPFLTLVTGVIALGSYTVSYLASFTIAVEFLGWIRLHTAQTFRFFWLCSIELAHDRLEFFILIPCGNVNATDPAI